MSFSDRAPEVATPRLMAYTTSAFYLAGGTGAILSTLAGWPHPGPRDRVTLVLAGFAVLCSVGLFRGARFLPRWIFHITLALASLMLGTGVVLSASDTAAIGLGSLFVLCAFANLYFFTRRGALAHTTFLLVVVAGSLSWRGIEPGVIVTLAMLQIVVVVVVGWLVQRAAHGTRDSLTDLLNRRGFDERLEETVTTAHRTDVPLSVALIDIDHFKAVNDTAGHAAGDDLLTTLSDTLQAHLAPGTVLARHGGDEFALLTRTDLQTSAALAEALRQLAAPTGLSIGVAQLGPREHAATLMRRADNALYEAKAAGRGQVRAATANDEALLDDLRSCLAAHQTDDAGQGGHLTVALQPVLALDTRQVVGVEALARWQHPQRGSISPTQFIALAEANGLISALDTSIFVRACRDALWLRRTLGRHLFLTVNVSGRHLVETDFAAQVIDVLARTHWPVGDLIIEVTETTVEAASSTAHEALQQLRGLGVKVAIDDFGTGYSALSQLDALPADYLKLDARFTSQITTSARRRAVLTGLLRMAHDLQLDVIAEGVETSEQEQALRALGCPLAQGYLFHRPAPAASLAQELIHEPDQRRTPTRAQVPTDSRAT